jgi:hypothetical protein
MYDLVELYNENGLKAYVQRKHVKDWQAKGWSTQKPGGAAVEAYAKKQEEAAQDKE